MLNIGTIGRLVAAVAGIVTLSAAAPTRATRALFHARLIKSEPATNDTLTMAPSALRFWFSEKVELPVTTVKLTSTSGAKIALGPVVRSDTAQNAPVAATITTPIPPGTYVVTWSTAAKDGHAAKGSFGFVVKAAR